MTSLFSKFTDVASGKDGLYLARTVQNARELGLNVTSTGGVVQIDELNKRTVNGVEFTSTETLSGADLPVPFKFGDEKSMALHDVFDTVENTLKQAVEFHSNYTNNMTIVSAFSASVTPQEIDFNAGIAPEAFETNAPENDFTYEIG